MPVFTSQENLKSGVPLGGIGAGKFEILPNGLLNAITFQNNWSRPLVGGSSYPGILGFHMGVRMAPSSGSPPKAFLLQTVPVQDLELVEKIRYTGDFPTAELRYEKPGARMEIVLRAFSPWIPSDSKHSSLPAACFSLRVKNVGPRPVRFGFVFIGINICGPWCVGRQNRVKNLGRTLSLEFRNGAAGRNGKAGSFRFCFRKRGWRLSFMESWNAVTRNFSFDAGTVGLKAWDIFVREGRLPNTSPRLTVEGENQELCGAVSADTELRPGQVKELEFTAAWFFPDHPDGHRYTAWFKDSAQVSRYVMSRTGRLRRAVESVQKRVFSLPFPRWFNEALLTSLSPFFASSWFVRDGRFAFYEAPVICPLLGTLDVGFYGSIPLSYFFPDLEKSQITLFAEAQRKDGYIPHDLGRNRLDLPSNGTTFYFWKDLNPKFVLMVYRDMLWSRDPAFLKRLYPSVKRAMRWSVATDRNGDGLPDHEGQDQTFDLWAMQGAVSYTSGIYLASLLASEKMARLSQDKDFAGECRSFFQKGRQSFETEMWNGEFFGPTCSLSQLNGQWYADLLGLGLIASRPKIRKAMCSVLRHNAGKSLFGMVNSVNVDGRLDLSNSHSRNIWCGMNYAFAGLCFSQGIGLSAVLKELHKLWDNVVRHQRDPWSQPDMMDAQTGRFLFGDSYYRNMAIWSIPMAYALKDARTARVLRDLKNLSRRTA